MWLDICPASGGSVASQRVDIGIEGNDEPVGSWMEYSHARGAGNSLSNVDFSVDMKLICHVASFLALWHHAWGASWSKRPIKNARNCGPVVPTDCFDKPHRLSTLYGPQVGMGIRPNS